MAKEIYELAKSKEIADFEKKLKDAGIIIENDMALLEAGHKLIDENKINEAIGLYEYYIKAFPNIIVAHNDLGDLYQLTGQIEKAIVSYKNALKINPNNERARTELNKLQ
jgi:tetratricopeptide (TPR) repeat protein